jgi:DNA-binding XRE family transcriptional regulator
VALSQQSGIARATLTQLESGHGNPTLETLYALADTLRIPLADLLPVNSTVGTTVIRNGEAARVSGTTLDAALLARIPGSYHVDLYDMTIAAHSQHRSAPHRVGTIEHVHVHSGRLAVGSIDEIVQLAAGDFARFDGGKEHIYNAPEMNSKVTLAIATPVGL